MDIFLEPVLYPPPFNQTHTQVDLIVVIATKCLHLKRCLEEKVKFDQFLPSLYKIISYEKYHAFQQNRLVAFEKRWSDFAPLF